ncbi:hypothetical protein AGMMS49965_22420 [Bacteroidia bacterium]|nr:hypothetical protein AGMMS49965_22420 [Bacteroidia bacterium]
MLALRPDYGRLLQNYQAEVYLKGYTKILTHNKLYSYAPSLLYLDRRGKNPLIECLLDVHYRSPNIFTSKIKAIRGGQMANDDVNNRNLPFLNVNIYNPSVFDNQILIPDEKQLFDYYDFKYIEGIAGQARNDSSGGLIHQIEFIPKTRSQRLLSGYFYIVDGSWNISRVDIGGRWEFYNFRVQTTYGTDTTDFLLPLHSDIAFGFKLFGNHTKSYYSAYYDYQSAEYADAGGLPVKPPTTKANDAPATRFDTTFAAGPYARDSLFWEEKRPVPLSDYEQSLVERPDSSRIQKPSVFWNIAATLVSPHGISYESGEVTYSGLLNPLKFSYSRARGGLYWQEFGFFHRHHQGQEFLFQPSIGYMFREKKLYFKTPLRWLFQPKRQGRFYATMGNREQSYNSTFLDQLKREKADPAVNIDSLNLEYYRHYYSELSAQYEIAGGLLVSGGINYDWYVPAKKHITEGLVIDNYYNFAPVIRLQWTPGQYYRMNEEDEEYLRSHYPTVQLEYAQGIKGVLRGKSHYKRLEGAVQQKIPTGLLSSLQYYVGGGFFADTQSTYFADFQLFQQQNIPQSWSDPIGGTFHALRSEWYHAADSYVQAHFMYESPLLFLKLFKYAPKDILNERLYFSQLYTPAQPSYTEIGYGFGNFFLNTGIFAAFDRWKFDSIGGKFVVNF